MRIPSVSPSFARSFARSRVKPRALPWAWALGLALTGVVSTVQAAGFELTPPGARGNGRAGAVLVGADDPNGLFYNPASILNTSTRVSTGLSVHLNSAETCFQRNEVVEGPNGARTQGVSYANVCEDAKLAIIPELATTWRLAKGWALGFGLYAPPAGSSDTKFGNVKTGTLNGSSGDSSADQRSPTRYLLMGQKQLQVFPTLGLAYQLHPQLRLGASFGWGITKLDFTNAGFSRARAGGAFAVSDISTQLEGTDWFAPRVSLGIWAQPAKNLPLELGFNFTWTGDVTVDDAKLTLHGLNTDIIPPEFAALSEVPQIDGKVNDVKVTVPQVSQLMLGVRYVKKLATPADRIGDRLSTERFDIELNFGATFGSNMQNINLRLPKNSLLRVPQAPPGVIPAFEVRLPERTDLPRRWQTQAMVRLGGDYNPLPGLLGLRLGVSYDAHGVESGYENIDFSPFQNIGLHAGATVRIAQRVDLSASFAQHIFPAIKVSVQDAKVRRVVAGDPNTGDDSIVNAGRYTRKASAGALDVVVHF